jgi:diguanylate cyclase (GGDEF)-like protein
MENITNKFRTIGRDISILIVDDDPLILNTISKILKSSNPNYFIITAEYAEEAKSYLKQTFWDIILLDLAIPVAEGGTPQSENGLKLLDFIKNDMKISSPVIAITGYNDDEISDTILDKGAYYFLNKPLRAKSLSAIIQNASRFQLAGFDGLTGLLTKDSFEDRLESEFERVARKNKKDKELKHQHSLSLIFFDGDNFKQINDMYSHLAGDKVLRKIGSSFMEESLYRLNITEERSEQYIIRPYDIASRFGGDEFAIFLPETDHAGAVAVAKRIKKKIGSIKLSDVIEEQIPAGNIDGISLSIGIASYPEPNRVKNFEELILKADEAMYASKQSKEAKIFGYDKDGGISAFS